MRKALCLLTIAFLLGFMLAWYIKPSNVYTTDCSRVHGVYGALVRELQSKLKDYEEIGIDCRWKEKYERGKK